MFTNEDRVETVDVLITTFCARLGVGVTYEDPDTIAGDMIASLLHWVHAKTGNREDALGAVRTGISHYITESNIDYAAEKVDVLGPETSVEIQARCNGEHWHTSSGGETYIK